MPGGKTARNVSKDTRRRSATTGRRRRFYARNLWRRRKWPEGCKSRRTGLSDPLQDGRPRLRARGSHFRTDERSVEKRSTEQARVRSLTRITSAHGSSKQQHRRSLRGGAQGTGTASRVLATHVGAAITDAAGSSATGVCSDGNTTSSDGMDIRGDAAKDLARVARDGSTSEGQRLREQLWVWLHLQDEEATEPVPKHIQSWLTGQKNATAKGIQKKQATSLFASGLDRDLLSTTHRSSRCQTRLRTTTPTNPKLDGGLGRDLGDRTRQVEGHPNATKTMDDNPQTPVRAFLEYVSAQ